MEEILGRDKIKQLIQGGSLKTPNEEDLKDDLYDWRGLTISKNMSPPSTMEDLKTWKAREDDIFIVAYPKAGCTWVQEITCAIVNNGNLDKLNKSHSWMRVPFLECTFFFPTKDIDVAPTHKLIEKMPSPRNIKCHLSASILPPDVWRKKSRVIYVARNPKDVAVSFYHFHNINPQIRSYDTWEEFFPDFYKGKVPFGRWADHYLSYWKKRHEPNVLFLKYEDIQTDTRSAVIKMADFLGHQLSDETITRIMDHCSFSNMKKNPMTNPDYFLKDLAPVSPSTVEEKNESTSPTLAEEKGQTASFMRKGKTGDWKNYITVAQNDMFNDHIQEKLKGTGLSFEYD